MVFNPNAAKPETDKCIAKKHDKAGPLVCDKV
jgi:hypothetical protein